MLHGGYRRGGIEIIVDRLQTQTIIRLTLLSFLENNQFEIQFGPLPRSDSMNQPKFDVSGRPRNRPKIEYLEIETET